MRNFSTGATRNNEEGKLDYEGFLAPEVLEEFAKYMHSHRKQADKKLRSSDNWQCGIPKDVYMKSMYRHFMDMHFLHRGHERTCHETGEPLTKLEILSALMFNIMGYMFEELRKEEIK